MFDMPPDRVSGTFGTAAELELRRHQTELEEAKKTGLDDGREIGLQDGRDSEKIRLQRIMAGELTLEDALHEVELLDRMHVENQKRKERGEDPITLEQLAEYAGDTSLRAYAGLESSSRIGGEFLG